MLSDRVDTSTDWSNFIVMVQENHIYLYFIPHVTFSSNCLHFLHLRRRIETELIFPYVWL